eukprot:TRINITY_DN4830_c0_g1_i3.p1 TRINITY_DN4830_c0_g1~~TRINITY_DN4830_c0_g1_i3.p1  ORF type:complete len:359 (+),score=83.00 TRINITY_DN4830_c0_g1_i3:2-1078(+)
MDVPVEEERQAIRRIQDQELTRLKEEKKKKDEADRLRKQLRLEQERELLRLREEVQKRDEAERLKEQLKKLEAEETMQELLLLREEKRKREEASLLREQLKKMTVEECKRKQNEELERLREETRKRDEAQRLRAEKKEQLLETKKALLLEKATLEEIKKLKKANAELDALNELSELRRKVQEKKQLRELEQLKLQLERQNLEEKLDIRMEMRRLERIGDDRAEGLNILEEKWFLEQELADWGVVSQKPEWHTHKSWTQFSGCFSFMSEGAKCSRDSIAYYKPIPFNHGGDRVVFYMIWESKEFVLKHFKKPYQQRSEKANWMMVDLHDTANSFAQKFNSKGASKKKLRTKKRKRTSAC